MIPVRSWGKAAFLTAGLAGSLAWAQPYVDTVAGGNLQSRVLAPNLVATFGAITQDSARNAYLCTSNDVIRRLGPDGIVEVIAGTGVTGYSGDGGPAVAASLNSPSSCISDRQGNLIFAEEENYRIRRIDSSGVISTVVGTGRPPGASDPPTSPSIDLVGGLALDATGNIYFAETFLHRIRRMTSTGKIELVAGSPQDPFSARSSGDGGPAIQAGVAYPFTLSFDRAGNLYFADGDAVRAVRRITPGGMISTVAGNGLPTLQLGDGDGGPATSAGLASITSLTADAEGNLYIAEERFSRARIRRVDRDGTISSVAGSLSSVDGPDGPALDVFLGDASHLFVDADGALWFANNYVHSRIQQLKSGTIRTVVGGGLKLAPDGIAARDAWLIYPESIAVSRSGELYIGEGWNCTIRKVGRDGLLTTVAGTGDCGTLLPVSPVWIAVDSQGQVFVTDGFEHQVWSISHGLATRVANLPGGKFALDSQDRLYVVTSHDEVWRLVPGGSPELYAGGTGGKIGLPLFRAGAITFDVFDNLYIRQYPPSGDTRFVRIYRITPSGVVSTVTPAPPDFIPAASMSFGSLLVDRSFNVWENSGLNQLIVRGPTLGYFESMATGYRGDGGPFTSALFNTPGGLTLGPDGSVLVLDSRNSRIRRISGPSLTFPPLLTANGIVNSASLAGGAVAPGELVSIFGTGLGPLIARGFTPLENRVPASLGNVEVLFDGSAAPITAISANQINAFVPYALANRSSATVVVKVDGVSSASVTVPVAKSAFGLFTANSSGSGQGAILNQDTSYNGPASAASAGSIVSLYATGEGLTSPSLPDGVVVTSPPFPAATEPIGVMIGGQPAELIYSGAAPSLPTGVYQINVRIPAGTPRGDASVVVTVGGKTTSRSVTVAVQ